MDLDGQNNNLSEPSQAQDTGPAPYQIPPGPQQPSPRKRKTGWRIFWGIILTLSVLANIVLLLMLIGLGAVLVTGQGRIFTEEVIQSGPRATKIAVIRLEGIIYNEQAEDVRKQIKLARQDKTVKALIIRVISPGGTVSASDQIHNEIRKFRRQAKKPVVAFMQGIALSGGYYTSVACDKIVAEPTTITGSIGVMMGHFVLQELLEDKLGIQPVIIKSGPRKDWPSSFSPVTDEQRQYVHDKLITPAYERFLQLVTEGRTSLTAAQVKKLADGSIFSAPEALDEKLIDEIGYIDEAIKLAQSLAGVEKAQVIEYRKPFSVAGLLTSKSANTFKINQETLYKLAMPQLLYLWNIYE